MRRGYSRIFYILLVLYCLEQLGCVTDTGAPLSEYEYMTPDYNSIELLEEKESLCFRIRASESINFKSFNYFSSNNREYVSIYKKGSETIAVYALDDSVVFREYSLKDYFPVADLYRTTAYIQNFDSLIIVNEHSIVISDSSWMKRENIAYDKVKEANSFVANSNPPVFREEALFSGTRSYLDESSFSDLRSWKTLYKIDLKQVSSTLCYNFPEIYQNRLLGYYFMHFSYCYNNNDRFVFSFTADPNIYETDLSSYHVSYYGKSRFQDSTIASVNLKKLTEKEKYREYLLRDTYGPIYFDPVKKRYLRAARHKISRADYNVGIRRKPQSIIIFDESFRIIGESPVDENVSLSSMFITDDGRIYARTNRHDKSAIHFVRFAYKENTRQLTYK